MTIEQTSIKSFLELMKLDDGTPLISAELLDWLVDNGFFKKPAAIKYHGNQSGGLFDHSRAVTQSLLKMTNSGLIQWKNPRSPYIVGMFHDICKVDDYIVDTEAGENTRDPLGLTWCYNKNKILNGHGDKSVMLLSQFINLTEEEIMCIRFHMGAYETENWDAFDRAIRKYPNVLFTHTADMWASKVLNL